MTDVDRCAMCGKEITGNCVTVTYIDDAGWLTGSSLICGDCHRKNNPCSSCNLEQDCYTAHTDKRHECDAYDSFCKELIDYLNEVGRIGVR